MPSGLGGIFLWPADFADERRFLLLDDLRKLRYLREIFLSIIKLTFLSASTSVL